MLTRRNFVKKSTVALSGLSAFNIIPSKVWSGDFAPSDKINIGLIGCRNMGYGILRHHLSTNMVNPVALCDVDDKILKERAQSIADDYGVSPHLYTDYRELLDRKDIDAVIIGTPDHWHCLMTVDACSAGKDVYVEKPLANTIEECNIIVKAAKQYKRIVQVGQQQRSGKVFKDSIRLIKSGKIGQIRKISIWCNFRYGLGASPSENSAVPEGVDYDLWLGPAALRPFNKNHFHGSWRHFWNYGGGLMSDWGVHLIDIALWADDVRTGPGKVLVYAENTSSSSNFERDTFDTMNVVYPYENFVINFDLTAGIEYGPFNSPYGIQFIGDEGSLVVNREKYQIFGGSKSSDIIFDDGRDSHFEHVENFLQCIKTRENPVCPPIIGRASALHVHIANIAARIGESSLVWDDDNNQFVNNEKANELLKPNYRAPWKLPSI